MHLDHGQSPVHGPRQARACDDLGHGIGQDRRHPLPPPRILRPAPDDDPITALQQHLLPGEPAVIACVDPGEPGQRRRGAGREHLRPAAARGLRHLVPGDVHHEPPGNLHPDRSPVPEGPDEERGEGGPHPDIAVGSRLPGGQVEGETDLGRLLEVDGLAEEDGDQLVPVLRGRDHLDRRAVLRGAEPGRLRLDTEVDAVEEVAGDRAAGRPGGLAVDRRHVQGDVDHRVTRDHDVSRGGRDVEVVHRRGHGCREPGEERQRGGRGRRHDGRPRRQHDGQQRGGRRRAQAGPERAAHPAPDRGSQHDDRGEHGHAQERSAATLLPGAVPGPIGVVRRLERRLQVARGQRHPRNRHVGLRLFADHPDGRERVVVRGTRLVGLADRQHGVAFGFSLPARLRHGPGLEQLAHRVRQGESIAGRQLVKGVALGNHRARVCHQPLGRVELPGAQCVPDWTGQRPVSGERQRAGVGRPGGRAGIQQRRLLVAQHPCPPQVVEALAGLRLQQVEQAAPVGWPCDGLRRRGVGRTSLRDHRLIGTHQSRGIRPHSPQHRVTGALLDRLRERQAGGEPVGPNGAVRVGVVRPVVERDGGGGDCIGHDGSRTLDLEFRRGPQGVQGREPLTRPSIREQAAVEPAVGGLVDHHHRLGPVGHLDPPVAAVEQGGISAVVAAHGLLDDQGLRMRPVQPDLPAQCWQGTLEQGGHPGRPAWIVLPGADREADRLGPGRHRQRRVHVDGRPLPRHVGEERERVGKRSGLEDRSAIRTRRLPVERAALDHHVEPGRDHDLHGAPPGAVGRESPDGEGHETGADPDLPVRVTPRVRKVERQPQLVGLAAVQAAAKIEPEHRVGRRPLGDLDGGPLPAGHLEAGRAGQDRDGGAVEVVAAGLRLGLLVPHGEVHDDLDSAFLGENGVRGGTDEREVGCGRPRLVRRQGARDGAKEQHGGGCRERQAQGALRHGKRGGHALDPTAARGAPSRRSASSVA